MSGVYAKIEVAPLTSGETMTAADIAIVLGAVGILITSITTSIVTLRRVKESKEVLREDVKAVHKIVNQQRTDMLAYQATLVETLLAAGIHVPTDESLEKKP
jgi:hypothetical protein